MSGHSLGQGTVGSGGKVDFPALAMLRLQEVKHFRVVGQARRIQGSAPGYLGFQPGLAFRQP